MSSTSPPLLLGDPRAYPEWSTESNLVGIAPFTTEVIAKRRATKTEVLKEVTYEKSSASKSEEAVVIESGYDLDVHASRVTQK